MILTPLERQNIGLKIYIRCQFCFKIGLSCDAVKHYKISVPSKKSIFIKYHESNTV